MGAGSQGQSVEDMERVIGAMRRVVERLQSENEALKKKVEKVKSNSELTKENKNLKVHTTLGCVKDTSPPIYRISDIL